MQKMYVVICHGTHLKRLAFKKYHYICFCAKIKKKSVNIFVKALTCLELKLYIGVSVVHLFAYDSRAFF